jgi:hypothetical protein
MKLAGHSVKHASRVHPRFQQPVKNGAEEWPDLVYRRNSHEYAHHAVGSTEWMRDEVGWLSFRSFKASQSCVDSCTMTYFVSVWRGVEPFSW